MSRGGKREGSGRLKKHDEDKVAGRFIYLLPRDWRLIDALAARAGKKSTELTREWIMQKLKP
jgi:hypothetical protein